LRVILKSILIVCYDSGGAEVVSSWVNHNPGNECAFILDGPAKNVFYRKHTGQPNYAPKYLSKLISQNNSVLTGTSWTSDLEKRAIKIAKKKRVKVASFLDHWVSYPERFHLNDEIILPDEIWVGDEHALEIAKEHFPSERIKFVPNPYFEDIRSEIEKITDDNREDGTLKILYVSDPIEQFSIEQYGHANHFCYNEYEALDNFLNIIAEKKLKNYEIRIRQHPSEAVDKYRSIIKNHPELLIKESSELSLIKDCAGADWIVGQQSMALAVGLISGKEVFSCIPNGGRRSELPFEMIREFQFQA